MSEDPKLRRRFRFRLRTLFVATAIVALISALLTRTWNRTQLRREYVNNAGSVKGHERTMQGYEARVCKSTLSGILFGDHEVTSIWLYPGTYSSADLAYIRDLFPEATIKDYVATEKSK